ncbi:hypothetical protein Desca_1194 [Desulfotomaculum nigrificans CO-1-SRB]|uniref:Uncharacterized protein n=1 Tax=Desulfotomaculum nigrificans (strain DSM 14880 / VKM B-2319 / CO-1-SRB) TaxID=868595 RepID=F6B400_DESCC|nr:hypothetical protein [Desulfotomaculum nigrificans]AEF94055.1 hypothetical protein Desca_1194 [Desulfotomaculum nigrificans CO-1-SRB]
MATEQMMEQIKQLSPKEQRYSADSTLNQLLQDEADDEEVDVFGLDIF